MKSIKVLAAVAAVVCVGAASERSARADTLQIEILRLEGTGCPPGSVPPPLSDDTGFSLTFLQYDIQTPRPLHKFCNVRMQVRYPRGRQFAIFNATYNGFASLGRGVYGIFDSRYWFRGNAPVGDETRLNPGHFGPFSQTDAFGARLWSPCTGQAMLTVKTEIGLSSAASRSYMNLQDQDLTVRYGCQWRSCR